MADALQRRIVVVGAGGHARVIVNLLSLLPGYAIVGVLDRTADSRGERVASSEVIGGWDGLEALRREGVEAVALALGDNDERARMFDHVRTAGFDVPALRHPQAIVDRSASIGAGSVLCVGSIVCADVQIGRGVIINSGAIIDHECRIGDHVHIAPGCRIAGRVTVGDGTFVGIGTTVRDQIRIGHHSVIGAGSVVISDLSDRVVAYGVPARPRGAPAGSAHE